MSECQQDEVQDEIQLKETIFDLIRNCKDPEKPETLEELDVICEEGICVKSLPNESYLIEIEFKPTVPHCSLTALIGLILREKLQRELPFKYKLDIFIKKGTHQSEHDVNKQINDKERAAAALENPNLKEVINLCLDYERE